MPTKVPQRASVVKATARIKKAAIKVRQAREWLKQCQGRLTGAKEKFCSALSKAAANSVPAEALTKSKSSARADKLAAYQIVIGMILEAVSPEGLLLREIADRIEVIKAPRVYQLLHLLATQGIVRLPRKGPGARWSLQWNPEPVYEAKSAQVQSGQGKRQKPLERYEELILSVVTVAGTSGISKSKLLEAFAKHKEFAKVKAEAVMRSVKSMVDRKVIARTGETTASLWHLPELIVVRPVRVKQSIASSRRVGKPEGVRAKKAQAKKALVHRLLLSSLPRGVTMSTLRGQLEELEQSMCAAIVVKWCRLLQADGLATSVGKSRATRWLPLRQQALRRPDSLERWECLVQRVWDLHPHREFEEFCQLVKFYAPYVGFDVTTTGSTVLETGIARPYHRLHGTNPESKTPLPTGLLGLSVQTSQVPAKVTGKVPAGKKARPAARQKTPLAVAEPGVPQDDGTPKSPQTGCTGNAWGKPRKPSQKVPQSPVAKDDLEKKRRKVRYIPERRCSYPNCSTILRQGNQGSFCSRHQDEMAWQKLLGKPKG